MNEKYLSKNPDKIKGWRIAILFLIGLVSMTQMVAQNPVQIKKWIKDGQYNKALQALSNYKKIEKNPDYLILRAVCYYHTDKIESCLADLKLHESFNTGEPLLWKYSGLSLMKKGQFEIAAEQLKKYLSLSKSGQDDYQNIILEVRRCGHALQLERKNQIAFVENVGPLINSPYHEIRPVYSPNFQDRLYYSSNRTGSTGGKRNQLGLVDDEEGQYFADMYYSDFKDGNWSEPTTFLPLLNSPKHDIIGDFNTDGNILYFGQTSDFTKFEYYSDTFTTEYSYEKLPVRVDLPLSGVDGDKDLFIFNDSLLFFASSTLPGYGGYDLFYSKFQLGNWQEPVNLGPEINTEFNEEAPYISKGGKNLYFSSDRIEGFGGHDIFQTIYQSDKKQWEAAVNLGKPINSPWDENHFLLASDGMSGVYTSNKSGGSGGSDIYIAYFKEQIIEQLLFATQPSFMDSITNALTSEMLVPESNTQKKTVRLPSLYYVSNEDILSNQNEGILSKLAENLLIYPDTRLTIYAHSNVESNRDMELYLSLKRAETVMSYLIQRGVDPYRIAIKACGSSFTVSPPFINGIPSNIAEKNNKRIDFSIISIAADIQPTEERTNLTGVYLDDKYKLFRESEDTLVFRLLIAQTQQMFRSEVLNHFQEIFIEKTQNQSSYNYLLGQFSKYQDAVQTRSDIELKYNIKSVILPYYKGKPLAKELYGYMSKSLPELQEFVLKEE